MALCGCLNFNRKAADVTYYTFNANRYEKVGEQPGGVAIRVRRFDISEAFQGRSFVYRTSANTFQEDFYRQFFFDPANMITEVTVRWFAAADFVRTVEYKEISMDVDYEIRGVINELYVDAIDTDDPRVRISITFHVYDTRTPRPRLYFKNHYSRERPLEKRSAEKIMEVWDAGLTGILNDFDNDLRTVLQDKENEDKDQDGAH